MKKITILLFILMLSVGIFAVEMNNIKIPINDISNKSSVVFSLLSFLPDLILENDSAYSYFGYSVCAAGDVNGDGFSDMIIGARGFSNGESLEGKVYLYEGNQDGLSSIASWSYESDQTGSFLGMSVASAGDINSDGFSDIIIAAPYYDSIDPSVGKVLIYYGSIYGLSNKPDWVMVGSQHGCRFGSSVSSAGDVNNDGYSDVIISAPYTSNGESEEGQVFLYYGSEDGLSTTCNWTCEGNQSSARIGSSLSHAGDVNGDGYSDIIIGSCEYDINMHNDGCAFVYYGSNHGLDSMYNWVAYSDQSGSYFGCSVSTAGDINGDGYSDVIIGAKRYQNSLGNQGLAVIYYGSSSGLSASIGWICEEGSISGQLGCSVSCAGDVNGDGYSDIIIGDSYFSGTLTCSGSVLLYFGSRNGVVNYNNQKYSGDQEYSDFGFSVSGIGDVNGDGLSDFCIGSPYYDNGENEEGRVYVYSSEPRIFIPDTTAISQTIIDHTFISVSYIGDINNDGYSDVAVGNPNFNNYDGIVRIIYGNSDNNLLTDDSIYYDKPDASQFGYSIAYAGDVNGDGCGDMLISAPNYDNGDSIYGAVLLYLGTSTGVYDNYNWLAKSPQNDSKFGTVISTANDVNGDGYSDIAIGAPQYVDSLNMGAIFIYYGSSLGLPDSANCVLAINEGSVSFGSSLSAGGDINGDGYSDLVVGASSYGIGGAIFVYYGSEFGIDTIPDIIETDNNNAYFGDCLSHAGDVNGDGFSDIIVGAPEVGAAYVFYGSKFGLDSIDYWINIFDQNGCDYGKYVDGAGDVNMDGYSDIIISAPWYTNSYSSAAGKIVLFYGNEYGVDTNWAWSIEGKSTTFLGRLLTNIGDFNADGYSDFTARMYDTLTVFGILGKKKMINQMTCNNSNYIISPLYSGFDSRFDIKLIAKNYIGRDKIKLQWEAKPLGIPFDGTGLSESAYWLDTGIDGIERVEEVSGLSNDTYYKWRVRVKYDMVKGMPQRYSRWYYISDNAPTEVDLRTGSTVMINEINIYSMIVDDCIYLSVMGNGDRYVINKEETGKYISLGDMKNNEYTDKNPIEGMNEYRMDEYTNGKTTNKAEITVFYTSQRKTNMEGFYTNIEKLNREIKEQGLFIYDINGRQINKISNAGIYYIVKEIFNHLSSTEKVVIIQ